MDINEKIRTALEVLCTPAVDVDLRKTAEKVLKEYLESK